MVSKYALQYIQILLQVELVDKICCRLLILVRHSARSIYNMMRHACVIDFGKSMSKYFLHMS